MRLGLINSVFAQSGTGTKVGIKQTAGIGFDAVDIFADPFDIDAKERKLIKKTAEQHSLPIASVVCVALGLADFSPSVQRFHIDRVKGHLDLCYELDGDNVVLVIGEYVWERQIIPQEQQWQAAVNNVRALGKHAEELNLKIALELEPFKMCLINSIDSMERFLDEVGTPNVMANCDISHLHLTQTPCSQVRRLAGRIAHVHVSDCDGKRHGDLPPGRGTTPIEDYLKAIRDAGFDNTVSIELEYPPSTRDVVDWVAEAYEKTAEIMRTLGCRDAT